MPGFGGEYRLRNRDNLKPRISQGFAELMHVHSAPFNAPVAFSEYQLRLGVFHARNERVCHHGATVGIVGGLHFTFKLSLASRDHDLSEGVVAYQLWCGSPLQKEQRGRVASYGGVKCGVGSWAGGSEGDFRG